MSFSSRRRNYLLTPHRRDGLIEWMKSMLMHSFVLDCLDSTGPATFAHFEILIDEHRSMTNMAEKGEGNGLSRLKQVVPTVGTFHTHLPLQKAFEAYNAKYALTMRRHVTISFNEIRHIMNLAQIMALRGVEGGDDQKGGDVNDMRGWRYSGQDSPSVLLTMDDVLKEVSEDQCLKDPPLPLMLDDAQPQEKQIFKGPSLITFDGDQTLYTDGANFESNPKLANYLYLLLRHGVTVAVVTAAGYEYESAKYELRLSGLLDFFKVKNLSEEDCARFYLFGGECNYLLQLSGVDYKLYPVKEEAPGGWIASTAFMSESLANWSQEDIEKVLDIAEATFQQSKTEQQLRARVIRKKRSVGLIPVNGDLSREALDETVLRVQSALSETTLPFCAFNGGKDAWVDVGNKRVGVQILQSYLGQKNEATLHIGDQFLNTGNDYAARDVCPCVWITSPEETTYILKTILRLAGISLPNKGETMTAPATNTNGKSAIMNFSEVTRRTSSVQLMDVYTGEMK